MTQQFDQQLTIRVKSTQLTALQSLADQDDRNVNYVIRKAIDQYIASRQGVE